MDFCLNLNFGDNKRLVNDFSETTVISLFKAYFPEKNPTYNEFVANDSVKNALGLLNKSTANKEIGSSFKREVSANQMIRLREKVSQINNRLKREGVDYVYKIHNFTRVGQADLYTWDIRKVKGALKVDTKLQRAKDRRDLAFQKSKVVDDLEKLNIKNEDSTPIDLFVQLEKNPSDEIAESINREMNALSELDKGTLEIEKEVITPTEEVKPAVQELFESNPKLANDIYEALGYPIVSSELTSKGRRLLNQTFNKVENQKQIVYANYLADAEINLKNILNTISALHIYSNLASTARAKFNLAPAISKIVELKKSGKSAKVLNEEYIKSLEKELNFYDDFLGTLLSLMQEAKMTDEQFDQWIEQESFRIDEVNRLKDLIEDYKINGEEKFSTLLSKDIEKELIEEYKEKVSDEKIASPIKYLQQQLDDLLKESKQFFIGELSRTANPTNRNIFDRFTKEYIDSFIKEGENSLTVAFLKDANNKASINSKIQNLTREQERRLNILKNKKDKRYLMTVLNLRDYNKQYQESPGISDEKKQQAQQLYSQYLESLNKPNTNPLLQNNETPDVILPIGISGSGKSTWINSLSKNNFTVISPDEIRKELTGSISDQSKNKEVFEEVDKRILKALGNNKKVILDATNLNTKLRRDFINKIKEKYPNKNFSYKLFEVDPELSKERIKKDLESGKDRAAVPSDIIDRQFSMYKQTLEDIKSEDISNYDNQQEQDIEGFKEFVEKEVKLGIVKVYQGYDTLENRNVNYFTLNENEAKNYGKNVRSINLDTTNLLKANTEEYRNLIEQDYKNTRTRFDILDNSPEGLKKQNQFFDFLKSKDYKGIDFTMYSDSQYVISFVNPNELEKPSEVELSTNQINAGLKSVDILNSDKAKQIFDKAGKAKWDIDKILTELQIPKEQKELIIDIANNLAVEGKTIYNLREQIALELASQYSYTVEINTAKFKKFELAQSFNDHEQGFEHEGFFYNRDMYNADEGIIQYFKHPVTDYTIQIPITEKAFNDAAEKQGLSGKEGNTQHYSNLTVPGGTNYTENEIATPAITPNIKGHAQFATDQGIGWFRSDEQAKTYYDSEVGEYLVETESTGDLFEDAFGTNKKVIPTTTKIRRILEVQSDLFQKGRNRKDLTGIPTNNVITAGIFENEEYSFELNDYAYEAVVEDIYYEEENQTEPTTVYYKNGTRISNKEMEVAKKEYEKQNIPSSQNQFLQLLNKNNNWVTFFVKSIIQDSAKKGYEKVLFPTGNTAAKVEGHQTLEEFKKFKEARLSSLTEMLEEGESGDMIYRVYNKQNNQVWSGANHNTLEAASKELAKNSNNNLELEIKHEKRNQLTKDNKRQIESEITQIKQELEGVDREGFASLNKVADFYETSVANILKKQGYNPIKITDEYGNTWNEVSLDKKRDKSTILFNLSEKVGNLNKMQTDQWFDAAIVPIISRFSEMFPNIKSKIISENEIPAEVAKKVANTSKQINSFYHNGEVYIIRERVSKSATVEEFLHPFINALEIENKELYNSLLKEAKQLFPELKEELFKRYEGVYNSVLDMNREFLTQALTQKVSGVKETSLYQKFIEAIKNLINKFLKGNAQKYYNIELSNLDTSMTLSELATILNTTDKKFNFNPDTGTTYYSLNSREVEAYQNAPKTTIQKGMVDKVLDNNNLIYQTPERPFYYDSLNGITVNLKPAYEFAPKANYPNVDMKNFLNIANSVHDIVNELNVSITENKKDFINDLSEKSELTKFLNERGFDGKKVVRDILDPIYDYVSFLKKQNKSIVMSQVAVGNFVDNVADSIDLLEITKDGSVVVHKIKTIFTGPTDVQNLGKEGTLTKKLDALKKGFETEASIDAKLVKGLFGKDTKVSLQLVPVMITALSKENLEGAVDVKEIVPSKYGSLGIVYFPIESIEEDQKRFKLTYLEGIASRVIKSVPKEEKAKVLSQEEIDKQKVIDKLTEEQKGENSEKLNTEIQRVYKRIYETVKQYGSSSDEVRAELYKIFDPSKQQDYKAIEGSLDVIFNRLKEISEQDAALDPTNPDTELESLKLKEEKVKQYLSTVIQYINFVQETSLGMENLKANFQDVLSKKNDMSEYELLDKMRKIHIFSKSYKADLENIADQLQDVEDSNMFKKMNQNAINIISKIERDYYDNALPILSKILNAQFTEEYKSRVTGELNLKLASKEERLSDVENYPVGSARRKYLEKEIAGIKNEIAKLPSESIIQATIEGKLGDSSYFYSNLMANINNPDYVISASANILERVLIDLRLAMIPKQDAFSTELSKRLDVFGTSPDRLKELNESLTYAVNKIVRKSNGTIEEWKQLHLITDVDENVHYEHDKLKIALQQLNDGNGTKSEIEFATAALKQFERENFEDKYNSQYMAVLNSIDVYLSDGTNPKLMVEAIFDRIKQVKANYSSKNFTQGKNVTPEDMNKIKEIWKDYNNLFSELDRNGNPKTVSQLEVTKLLVSKRDALRNFSTVELNYDLFNKFRTQLLNDLIAEYGSEEEALKSDEYKEWAAYNVKTVLTQDFLDKRQSLIDEMTSILDKYKDENAQKVKSDIWKKIFNLLQGYRDNDNNYVASELSEQTKEKVRNLEMQLSNLDAEIKKNRGKLEKQDSARLSIIVEELQGLQSYIETPYYLEDYENALAKFAAKINSTPEQIKQSPNLFAQFKNEEWYTNSHVIVQKYNNFLGGYEDVEIPAYFYRTVVPVDPKYKEEQPASQYKVNIVDDQYLNPDYLDNFGRRQVKLYKPGSTNSIYRNPLHYEKIMVGSSEKDRVNRENLVFLKQQMDETQKSLHKANMIEYAIPTTMKTTWDRAMEGDFKGFWENFKTSFQKTEQETEYKTVLTDMTGEETKFIPVLYKNKIELDNQSYDVFGNILKYQMSATKSKMLDKKLSTFQVLQDLLEKFPVTQGESVVDQITNKLNKKYGWELPTGVVGKGELRKEAIRDLVNRIFYEEYKEDLFTIPFLNISDGKAADAILGYAGTNLMMLNFPNWIVNFFSGNIQLMIESASGRNLNKKDLITAKKELASLTPDIIRDMGKLGNKSLYGQLLDFFDPVKGEFIDEFGNKASWSVRRNLKSILFSGKIFGEWEMQNTAFIAMLKAKKVRKIDPAKQGEFDVLKDQLKIATTDTEKKAIEKQMDAMSSTIDLYTAFDKGPDGIPLIKEGVQINMEELKDYMQKIQGVNKALNGSYAKLDQLKWEKYSLGRMGIFMKKFFFPLLINRLGEFRGDMEVKDVREGYYRSFMNTVLKDLFVYRTGIPAIVANYNNDKYTPLQKEGIRKTLMDIAIITSIILLLVALGYYDDDDETDSVTMAQYLLLKINRESLTFSPAIGLKESYSILKSPFALMGYVGNLGKIIEMSAKYPLNLAFGAFEDDLYYQKKTALWQKGDSKFMAALLKLGGLKINHTDPDELMKSYNLQTGW